MAFVPGSSYVAPAPGGGYVVVTPGHPNQTFQDLNQAQQQYNTNTGQSNAAPSGGGGGGGGGGMNAQNFVGAAPGGGYVVYVNGQNVGTFADLQSAQNAYNNTPGSPTYGNSGGQVYHTPAGDLTIDQIRARMVGPGSANYNGPMDDASLVAAFNRTVLAGGAPPPLGAAGGATSASQKLLDAIASGDAAKLAEAIREFNVTSGETSREFDITAGQTAKSQYSQLAQALLATASQLRGPKDYYQFEQYTSGGRDLMNQLYGDQPRPDFSTPTGQIQPLTIADLMQKLGFTQSPSGGGGVGGGGAAPGGGGTAGLYNTINGPKSLDQMLQELITAGWGGPNDDRSPAGITAAYARTTNGPVTPQVAAAQVAQATPGGGGQAAPPIAQTPQVTPGGGGTGAPALQVPQATPGGGVGGAPPTATTPLSGVNQAINPAAAQTGPAANTGIFDPNQKVPMPYQINPIVWDALGPTGQALSLSIAGGQGWDTDEFQRQLNAQRPIGNAPNASVTQWSQPTSAYGAR